jgi:Leucine-rich repeat (LRR) protein
MAGQFPGTTFAGAATALPLLLASLWPLQLHAAIPAGERQVLINLYNASNGGGWTQNSNWCASTCPASGAPTFAASGTECTWHGIGCDAGGSHVTAIELSGNNLLGALPDLSGLSSLQYFSVVSNKLGGSIPALSGLGQLRVFYADNNALSGSLPSLAASIQLREFSVQSNALSGPIPSLAGLVNLNSFLANGNRLGGSIPSLSGLASLQDFEVGNNQLSGSIPALTGTTGLLKFVADHNLLSGSIPSLSAASGLLQVNLASNRLTGSVPAATLNLYTPLAWAPSSLCANPLNLAPSANDAGWNAATGFTPWWATPHASNQCDGIMTGTFE